MNDPLGEIGGGADADGRNPGGASTVQVDPFGDQEARAIAEAAEAQMRKRAPVWPPRPGVFAAIWPLYLVVAGVSAAAPFLSAKYVDDSIATPAVVAILGAFTLGLTLLLPLMRLSQSRSSDPVVESAMDAFSLLLPVQPLLWFTVVRPIAFGAGRVLVMDLHLIGWTAAIAGVVGLTLLREGIARADRVRRTLAMGAIVILQGAGPLAFTVLAAAGVEPPSGVHTFAPLSGMMGVLSTPRDPVNISHWIGLGVVWLLAAGVWWIALAERRSVLSCGKRSGVPAGDA